VVTGGKTANPRKEMKSEKQNHQIGDRRTLLWLYLHLKNGEIIDISENRKRREP
jgi:hypothetical protein